MTKLRQPLSLEDALQLAIGVLGLNRVSLAAGRTETTVRAWTDPDKSKPLPAAAALAVDCAMVSEGHAPPHFRVMSMQLDQARAASHIARAPHLRLVECLNTLGRVSQEISDAMRPDSEDGARLSRAELSRILAAIDEDAETLTALRRDVIAAMEGRDV